MLIKALRCLAGVAVGGLCLMSVHMASADQTLGPVSDPVGVVKIPKGAPIQIGGYWVLSGADTAMGVDSRRGAELR